MPINPELTSIPDDRGYTRTELDLATYNRALGEFCKQSQIILLDAGSIINPTTDLDNIDGLHPNTEGHQKLALFFQEVIGSF